ncbi:MAG: valine--tRNA ligase [Christensenellales bacterium]|jgi:valyl-tRNA synthetase
MKNEMQKVYDPKSVEDRIYASWEKDHCFHAVVDPDKEPFTIVIPPPNITGQLHMGHALDNTIQDVLIRFKRMQGYSALWMPGTDHASIATEVKIVDAMAKEGITKKDLGREGFLKRAWQWRDEYGRIIVGQLKKLGSSCDWERERFTMDEGCNKAVIKAFVDLYNKGLIYRGDRIINWCPDCKTALSDAEVEYEEQDSKLWHIRYKAEDGGEGLVVATTRPETMLGDTAVAVHPEDERYAHLVGKNVILPILSKPIPVIADEYVEREFGTGCVKITPAHDPNDYEVGVRHNLPMPRVMTDDGRMNENAGKFCGMRALECRKAIVEELEASGALVKTENYKHNVGACYRCHTTIEPLISKQWFVATKELAKPAIEAVRSGEIRFVPERFDKIYFNWMENIRDWCISRQLWWGHRIPAYYCEDCGEIMVAEEAPNECKRCGSHRLQQDEDVLDTWFSSGMWPFSTMGWPDHTPELDYFYPTSVLVTGYDIIFFWVARMIMFGYSQMGEKPFSKVLIHGIVRDELGRKMSKSLNNGIDPLQVIDEYGADSLRFSLTMGTSAGNDMRFYGAKVESCRNFANKIWNASRFVLMNIGDEPVLPIEEVQADIADRWILSRLNKTIREVTENLEAFELSLASQKVYDFIWSEFCDWYIEMAKPRLYGEDETQRQCARSVLLFVLKNTLKLLHPFMPFVTEEIYSFLPGDLGYIMLSTWPVANPDHDFAEDEAAMSDVMELITSIRNVRAELNVPPAKKTRIAIVTAPEKLGVFQATGEYLKKLAYADSVDVLTDREGVAKDTVSAVAAAGTAYLPLAELVDVQKEQKRLEKEKANALAEIQRAKSKLENPGFLGKAPQKVIDDVRAALSRNEELLKKLQERMEMLSR